MQHLEIHINLAKVKEEHFNEICSSIHTTIFSAIEIIFKVMRLEDIQVKSAFLCPCKCRPKFHAATVCHLSTGSYLVCTKSKSQVDCLQKEHQYWFQDIKKGETFYFSFFPWFSCGYLSLIQISSFFLFNSSTTKSIPAKLFQDHIR